MSGTLTLYERFTRFPLGNTLFSKALSFRAPYFSTIHPRVTELRSVLPSGNQRPLVYSKPLREHPCRCPLHSERVDRWARSGSNTSLELKMDSKRDDRPVHQKSKRQAGW